MASQVDGARARAAAGSALHCAMVAGEASGDLLAGLLLDGLQAHWPTLQAVGIGGPHMASRGFQAWWPHHKLAVRGYVEVLRHYREILSIRAALLDRLLQDPPDLFIGVDAPDFNMDLELALRRRGVCCVHFVCPSIWAWRPGRLNQMRECMDHVLCLFPFEQQLLERHGIDATYVGHPLASVIPMHPDRAAARARLGLPGDEPVLAVMPGSRVSELRYLARRFFDTAALLLRSRPGLRCVVPVVAGMRATIESHARDAGVAHQIRIVDGQSHDVLAACDVVLVASGTATLEAALFKRPMVIAYNMHPVSWLMMQRKRLQPWVGLPNILCEQFVVPELLQAAATPQALAAALERWLDDSGAVAELQRRFVDLHSVLLRDTPRLAAHAIEQVLAA